MNVLARSLARTTIPRAAAPVNIAGRRTFGTWSEFKKNWLSDAGAYPVIAILGIACAGCTVYGTWNLFYHPDIRITPSKRQASLRSWG